MLINWAQSAEDDLSETLAWIMEQGDMDAAKRIAARIFSATERLSLFPHSGRPGLLPQTRELVLPDLPYFLVYQIQSHTVEILRVIHTSRLWTAYDS